MTFKSNVVKDPSYFEGIKKGIPQDTELVYRQQCAQLIQELGLLTSSSQLVINTAIIFMHQFYVKYSPSDFKPVAVSITSFYLACKVKDTARKAELIINHMYTILRSSPPQKPEDLRRLIASIHSLEAIMLMVIGFPNISNDQPLDRLTPVLSELKSPRSLIHSSYFICTNMIHLTSLSVRYSAAVLAAASLYIAATWDRLKLPKLRNNKPWFSLFPEVTIVQINNVTEEFLEIFNRTPMKIKEKIRSWRKNPTSTPASGLIRSSSVPKSEPVDHENSGSFLSRGATPVCKASDSYRRTTPLPHSSTADMTLVRGKSIDPEEGELMAEPGDDQSQPTGTPCSTSGGGVKPRLSLAEYRRKKTLEGGSHTTPVMTHCNGSSQQSANNSKHHNPLSSDSTAAPRSALGDSGKSHHRHRLSGGSTGGGGAVVTSQNGGVQSSGHRRDHHGNLTGHGSSRHSHSSHNHDLHKESKLASREKDKEIRREKRPHHHTSSTKEKRQRHDTYSRSQSSKNDSVSMDQSDVDLPSLKPDSQEASDAYDPADDFSNLF